ncbi:putative restriction endonuclease [Lentibacillus persicus]|uniref:Putative restriction endonuclease n=1 Tax=Lentibacillus persicus TaxID=640948 RepID=A0A1I1S6M6_9BACI|nr:HNH endonuclease [Lentibacillus persicus]SFD42037.1 putative restriction endonuclease [Lentibacillus persicus]
MKFYVGVTDDKWFEFLKSNQPDELNFWRPGGKQPFKALRENDLFLFKLHSPNNYIVGGGFFVRHTFLPLSLAWEAFGYKNGTNDVIHFRNAIYKYRKSNYQSEPDPVIGCIILTEPFFFDRQDWIPVPKDWKPNIVQGKTYNTDTEIGQELYNQVQERLHFQKLRQSNYVGEDQPMNRYGSLQTVKPRIGQGAFRVMVTDAYHRKCAITGEKTLPVLDAAHIKPYSQNGPHLTNNGLLLRRDIHTLFDRGYITINEEHQVEVSKRIKADYGNGREYYALHGKKLAEMPDFKKERPSPEFLLWHNENMFLA